MYFLYSLGGVTFNKCWITLSILNCYSPNFQGFILMKNALNNQVGMLGDMFLWLVANLKQGVIYFIKQGGGNHKIAWVYEMISIPSTSLIFSRIFKDKFFVAIKTFPTTSLKYVLFFLPAEMSSLLIAWVGHCRNEIWKKELCRPHELTFKCLSLAFWCFLLNDITSNW